MLTPLTIPMSIIFENAHFIVTASNADAAEPTFEVVNCGSQPPRQAFLHGASAQWLVQQIKGWQAVTPSEAEVEETLGWLDWINAAPLVVH